MNVYQRRMLVREGVSANIVRARAQKEFEKAWTNIGRRSRDQIRRAGMLDKQREKPLRPGEWARIVEWRVTPIPGWIKYAGGSIGLMAWRVACAWVKR